MDLTAAASQADPHHWAATLLAHALIGATLAATAYAALARWTAMLAWPSAVQVVALAYAVIWEGLVQRLAAGMIDAAVDSAGVLSGALMAWGLWAHRWRLVRAPGAALAAILAVGVWRRTRRHKDDRA